MFNNFFFSFDSITVCVYMCVQGHVFETRILKNGVQQYILRVLYHDSALTKNTCIQCVISR